jgi:hypothetical protein
MDQAIGFDLCLIAIFLLTIFALVDYESIPILRQTNEHLLSKATAWAQHEPSHSALTLRLVAWLRLLHAASLRGGGNGLFSDEFDRTLLSMNFSELLNSKLPANKETDASVSLIETLSSPMFEFYFRLQMIANELPTLTHYHRTRNSWSDQEEVAKNMADIKQRLRTLWNERPATLSQSSQGLRALLAPAIADPIVALANVVTAAYYVEFIEMDRILGDPVSRGGESIEAMASLRELIDSKYASKPMENLNPAYIRPLFLYAIECMDASENDWSAEKMRQIRDPICRSDFFASFGAALLKAQLLKERRVTSKYFCLSYFGVPPPYL